MTLGIMPIIALSVAGGASAASGLIYRMLVARLTAVDKQYAEKLQKTELEWTRKCADARQIEDLKRKNVISEIKKVGGIVDERLRALDKRLDNIEARIANFEGERHV